MPAFNLTAVPGHHERPSGQPYTATIIEMLGKKLGHSRIEAKSVEEVAAHVRSFGEAVAKEHTGCSFMVLVGIVAGGRKPRGFDAANRRNGLGQETWMRIVDKPGCVTPGPAA